MNPLQFDTASKRESVSAWLDGDLDARGRALTPEALKSEDCRAAWGQYHLIGDVLRNQGAPSARSQTATASIFAALAAEPTVIAPAAAREVQASLAPSNAAARPAWAAWAVAASFAALGLSGWASYSVLQRANSDQFAAAPAPSAGAVGALGTPASYAAVPLADYLRAHQELAAPTRLSTLRQYAQPASVVAH